MRKLYKIRIEADDETLFVCAHTKRELWQEYSYRSER